MRPATTCPPARWRAAALFGLLLACAILTGCQPAGDAPQSAPPPPPPPSSATQPPVGADRPLGGCGEPLSGMGHAAEGPRARRFVITRQQMEVIGHHLIDVFCRQGLWKKDVGFGARYQDDGTHVLVLVNPGRSGLTARQLLDRLLGRP
jgi:hypothetical protein